MCTSFIIQKKMFRGASRGAVRRDGLLPTMSQKIRQRNVQAAGTYIKTLVNPESHSSCNIPDLASYPTQTFTVSQEIALTTSNGSCALAINLSGRPTFVGYTAPTAASYNVAGTSVNDFDAFTNINATYRAVRLVAASLRIEYQGSDASNQGIVVGTTYSTFSNLAGEQQDPSANTYDGQRNSRQTYVGPAKSGVYLTYRPTDSSSFKMTRVTTDFTYGSFLIFITNAQVSATSNYMAYVTLHYEGTSLNPVTSAMNQTPQAEPLVNPDEFNITQAVLPAFQSAVAGTDFTSGIQERLATELASSISSAVGGGSTVSSLIRRGAQALAPVGRRAVKSVVRRGGAAAVREMGRRVASRLALQSMRRKRSGSI